MGHAGPPRQTKRRAAFQRAFATMPMVDTWTTTHADADGEQKERNHVKVIPRRVRRDMARIRAKRD